MKYYGTATSREDLREQINKLVKEHIKKHGIKLPFKGKIKFNDPKAYEWLKVKEA